MDWITGNEAAVSDVQAGLGVQGKLKLEITISYKCTFSGRDIYDD